MLSVIKSSSPNTPIVLIKNRVYASTTGSAHNCYTYSGIKKLIFDKAILND